MEILGPDEDQQRAIDSDSRRIVCIAGAGSGKTYTMIQRILRLCREGVSPQHILATTFTRKAAREISDRLAAHDVRVTCGTIHSVCLKILRSHGWAIGYRSPQECPIGIVNEDDRASIMKAVREEILSGHTATDAQEMMEEISHEGYSAITPNRKSLFNSYYRLLKENNLVDIACIIPETIKLITESNLTEFYHEQWSHVFVDEAHDSNRVQWDFLMSFDPKNVFAVFDPRQTIYEWNGSRPEMVFEVMQSDTVEV